MRLLIADDLTGSCDAGIQFAKHGIRTVVAISPRAFESQKLPDFQLLALNTASRLLPAGEAEKKIRAACRQLRSLFPNPALIIKKIDSTLRGNLGVEIAGCMDSFNLDAAFIAPAYPEQGRLVVNGDLLINGVPLHKTAFAIDPANPINLASVPGILQSQGLVNVALVDTGQWQTPEALSRHVTSLLHGGCRYIVFDSRSSEDLALVAQCGMAMRKRPLFVGAAGLTCALADAAALRKTSAPKERPCHKVFMVCGSANEAALAQLSVLQDAHVPVFYLPENLEDGEALAQVAARAEEALQNGKAVLAAPRKRLAISGQELSSQLAALALDIVQSKSAQEAALCLIGGETAFAILVGLGNFMELKQEIAPGVVVAKLLDGPTVVAKAGGFGGPDTLLNIMDILSNGKSNEK